MDPTLVPDTRFESQFQICVYEHAILRIYISFFFQHPVWNYDYEYGSLDFCLEIMNFV